MNIICPFIPGMLRDETQEALRAEGAWFYPLDPEDGRAYGKVLVHEWTKAEDFLIVEQDMLPTKADIQLMRDCPEQYCAAVYAWTTDIGPSLGFTRFRREFMLRYPDAMREANERAEWYQLDVVLQRAILVRDHNEQPHIHPQVVHLNEAKALRPDADPNPLQHLPAW